MRPSASGVGITAPTAPHESAESGGYLVEYPDIPSCIADGKTAEEAIRHGRKVLEASPATLAEFAKRIPRLKYEP